MVTQVTNEKHVSGGSSCSLSQRGRAPASPKFLGTLAMPKQFDVYRATKFGVLIHFGSSVLLGVSHTPYPKGAGPHRLQNFVRPTYAQTI